MRKITTPGGETVEVIPDDDYIARYGLPGPGALRSSWSRREPVLAALWLHGPFEDKSGRSTALLHAEAKRLGYKGTAQALIGVVAAFDPAVVRELGGKRTYAISFGPVLPALWADRLAVKFPGGGDEEPEPEPEPEPAVEEPEAEPEALEATPSVAEPEPLPEVPSWDLEVTGAVALSLLTKVVEIIATGNGDQTSVRLRQERDEARQRLHQQTEYGEKLRRQLREAGDELGAVKHERDGLRSRLRQTEENLRRATSPDVTRQVDALVRAELDKVMRARPAPNKGPDAA